MEKKYYSTIILTVYIGLSNLLIAQDSKETDPSFEEFKASRKKEREVAEQKEKEQAYKDYLEFQEFKKKKSAVLSEEDELDKKRKQGKIAYSPWAVQYSGATGLLGGTKGENGSISQFMVAGEYHVPESKLGFRLGLSSWNYRYNTRNEKSEKDIISAAILSQSNLALALFLQSVFLEKKSSNVTSADFTFDYHFKPRQFFDPYLFSGFGIGTCSNQCNAMRVFAGVGMRINIKEGYFLSEVIVEKPFFTSSNGSETVNVTNIYSGGFRIGFGIFL